MVSIPPYENARWIDTLARQAARHSSEHPYEPIPDLRIQSASRFSIWFTAEIPHASANLSSVGRSEDCQTLATSSDQSCRALVVRRPFPTKRKPAPCRSDLHRLM